MRRSRKTRRPTKTRTDLFNSLLEKPNLLIAHVNTEFQENCHNGFWTTSCIDHSRRSEASIRVCRNFIGHCQSYSLGLCTEGMVSGQCDNQCV